MTTTESAIRDLTASLIAGITPTILAGTKFVEHRYDLQDFEAWAEANPDSCFRRFSVRDSLFNSLPESTNTDVEWRQFDMDLIVAYPRTNKAGSSQKMDAAIRKDMQLLDQTVGLNGYANYTTIASWLRDRAFTTIQDGAQVRFIRMTLPYGFYRSAL